jgi:hypothetical protein
MPNSTVSILKRDFTEFEERKFSGGLQACSVLNKPGAHPGKRNTLNHFLEICGEKL